ncbi:MAG: enoyl-CoA hydratase/isomerase family protein [Rhodobacteraceae bacterium]|nr:enoyl-CoA hydratase/isomerase family protein [Paracoccaceae bacterium]
MEGKDPVRTELQGEIALVTVDNPPVNALAHGVRAGLVAAIEASEGDPRVKAVVIRAAGRTFPAGADIREFGQPPRDPWLPAVCNRIEACTKPVVAALHGTALGGGLEVALGAHYRIALPSARVGLPEVTLGILPGAGGTQRTPRIAGTAAALDLMLSGKPVGAAHALAIGLIDEIAEGDLTEAALAYAARLVAEGAGPRPTRDRTEGLADVEAARAGIAAARAKVEKEMPHLVAPIRIVSCVEATLDLPFEEGLDRERELFGECVVSDQSVALRHAFFAERRAARVPGLEGVVPREIAAAGVIGGGTMGAGIAVALLQSGLPVTMIERDAESLARGQAAVRAVFDRAVERGRMTAETREQHLRQFEGATDYAALAPVDLAIEAVFEEMEVKREVLGQLDAVLRPGAIIASNTSYLDLDALAAMTSRPADVVGLHFFSPANVMRLLEVVVGAGTAPEVVAAGFALARRLGKVAVRAGVCEGFIGNRMLATYRQAADYMMLDGASPYEIDAALQLFGFAMGPFQVTDLAGGDIGWARRKRLAPTRDPARRYVRVADLLCERGWFGQKTGRGFYLYEKGARRGTPDPEVLAIIEAERAAAGVTPRSFSPEEIVARYLAAMVNEGARLLDEGIALRPSDIDVVKLMGYGFPRHRGGPMKWADLEGLPGVLENLRNFAAAGDAWLWEPAPLLERLVAEGRDLDSLND